MRLPAAILTCGLLLAGGCGAAQAGDGAGGASAGGSSVLPCGPRAANTLRSDPRARIYEAQGQVYGCARDERRSYRLGAAARTIHEGRVGPVALTGTTVAYGLASYGVDTGSSQVVVRRLTDGRQLKADPAITGPVGVESYSSVTAIVVKSDGAVAWIAGAKSIVGRGAHSEVHRDDRGGRSLLDSGTRIGARSLRLRGSQLRWRDGPATRSATLR